MKQHITKEQWNELNDSKKDKFLLTLHIVLKTKTLGPSTNPLQGRTVNGILPNIGQMIEFLGEDIGDLDIIITGNKLGWSVWKGIDKEERLGYKKELCDALFNAVKYKLNKI